MAVDRDNFFSLLSSLTEKEIEARLPTWDLERLKLAEEFIEDHLAPAGQAQPYDDEARKAITVAMALSLATADAANTKATAALIISVGAMMTAVLCGVIVVLL